MTNKKTLVLLSVPLTRILRVAFSPDVISALEENADVVVIGPFSRAGRIRIDSTVGFREYANLFCPDQHGLRRPRSWIYAFSEWLRMHGSWRRYAADGLGYYHHNRFRAFGRNRGDSRLKVLSVLASEVASVLGRWPGAWRVCERLMGREAFEWPELERMAAGYESVVLVHSAMWGWQDRRLSRWARERKWLTIVLPYTTDQLYCNGYLLNASAHVLVQGSEEGRFAHELHRLPNSRIHSFGSAWFRHLDAVAGEDGRLERAGGPRSVLFAGVDSTYYPLQGQFEIIDRLLDGVEEGRFGDARLVLRYVATEEERALLDLRYGAHPLVDMQVPSMVAIGLADTWDEIDLVTDIREYVDQISSVDLVVMAGVTSLCLDAAHLGVPSISVIVLGSPTLDERQIELRFTGSGEIIGLPGVPVIRDIGKLMDAAEDTMAQGPEVAARIGEAWNDSAGRPKEVLAALLGVRRSGGTGTK